MSIKNDFYKYARSKGVMSTVLNDYQKAQNGFYMPTNGYINPTIIEERQMNVASMDVFSRLMMDRIIFLGSEIDEEVSSVLVSQLLYLQSDNSEKDISIYINSPGGVVYDGLAIYDTMQYLNCDVATICTGMAASMASILLAAGTAGKRSALPHSRVMIHQPMGGARGQASDITIECNEINKLKKELYDILSVHSGQTYEKIEKDADRDYWMIASEAKDYGLIDNIFIKK